MTTETLIWLAPLPPLLAFLLIILFTNRSKVLSHSIAIAGALASFGAAMAIFVSAVGREGLAARPFASSVNWLPTGNTWFSIGVQIDPLSAVTIFFVAWTVLAIFVYSVGYHNFGQPAGDADRPGLPPHGASETDAHGHLHRVPSIEPMYSRFFAFISLFAFAMFTLVVSDNLLTLYVGWEIMGLCSYLLIGFWYAKPSARAAAIKAFLTTRVGDVFMLLGLAGLYSFTGSLNYRDIFGNPAVLEQMASTGSGVLGLSVAGLLGLLLFIGTVGKSAQFPLHIWLPDAMEGPTPVSAMIHAATMVSAGVYMAIRIFPLLSAGWESGAPLTTPMMVLAVIGSFTAIFAATIALAQNDIKRVLAYSTISQLGFMIAALGVGAYVAAVFHLLTHAFFKALLFLGSGSVIHGMEHGVLHTGEQIDPQDMMNMGGLRKKMPVTFWTFLIGGMALSGLPLVTAGFWSKDEILAGAFNGGHMTVFWLLAAAALLTAFYTARQITLTFLGKPRTESAAHASENKWTITAPMAVLAFFAVAAGWVGIPQTFPLLGGLSANWFEHFVGSMLTAEAASEGHSLMPLATSVTVALGGLFIGWMFYAGQRQSKNDPLQRLGPVYSTLKNKYYIDELYNFVFIRPVVWVADVFSSIWVDKVVIDGIVEGVGRAALGLGHGFRSVIDMGVINWAGDTIACLTRWFGNFLKPVQTGRIQQYMVVTLGIVILAAAAFYYFLVLA
jgi:NADH-quinone oxidoreductase subunit L